MTEFEVNINFSTKLHTLKATIEYQSAQIIRIRVKGNERSLLLETNYPIAILSKGKRITWKLREGFFDSSDAKTARMLSDIMEQLEYYLKSKHNEMTKQEYLGKTKW